MTPQRPHVELPDRPEGGGRRELQKTPGMDRELQGVAQGHAEDGPVRVWNPERGGDDLRRGRERTEAEGRRELRRAPESATRVLLEGNPESGSSDRHGDREDIGREEVEREE